MINNIVVVFVVHDLFDSINIQINPGINQINRSNVLFAFPWKDYVEIMVISKRD